VIVEAGSRVDTQLLGNVSWPEDSLIASIQHGSQVLVSHGGTILHAGDRLTDICNPNEEALLYDLVKLIPEQEPETQ